MPAFTSLALRTIRRLTLTAVGCISLCAGAAPTLTTMDLRLGRVTTGLSTAGTGLSAGSHLAPYATQAGDVFATELGAARQGVLGVGKDGSLAMVATDIIRLGGLTDTAATSPLGLSTRGGIASSMSFIVGVNSAGGLTYVDPLLSFNLASAPGLFSLESDLLAFEVQAGQRLFGQTNTLGAGRATGLLGTTEDGRLRLVRTDGTVGSATMVSRPLGFAAGTGLAAAAGFIAGVNAQGSINLYEPTLDLLFEDVGPAGLFSRTGGLETLAFGSNFAADLFDTFGSVADSLGVLGLTDDGGLAYLRLDVVPGPGGAAAFATLKRELDLGLDADAGLVVRNGIVTVLTTDRSLPEPHVAGLVALALFCSAQARRRKAPGTV